MALASNETALQKANKKLKDQQTIATEARIKALEDIRAEGARALAEKAAHSPVSAKSEHEAASSVGAQSQVVKGSGKGRVLPF